jgi:uncharacterized protein YjbI with pentapeptide repeats
MKQARKKYLLYATVIIVGGGLIFILIRLILAGYRVDWTGFGDYASTNADIVRGKTLWDWMELLVIPLVLALGAFSLQRSERAVDRKIAEDRAKLERELATDRQQEASLQAYLDRMAELLLKENLLESENEKVLNVARVRTLTVMRGLNAARNGIVLRFLHDIGLAGKEESTLLVNANLEGADLQNVDLEVTNLQGALLENANLQRAHLFNANLQRANLENANLMDAFMLDANLYFAYLVNANLQRAFLENANLQRARFQRANLQGARLQDANLQDANLQDANLRNAIVSNDQLATAESLKGVTMPDGTKHE